MRENLEHELTRLRARSLLIGQTVQPLVIAIGPKIEPELFYLIVNGVKYILPSLSEAVDTCFQVLFALSAQYPKQGERIWLTIQRLVYQITVARENFGSVGGIVTEIMNRLPEEF